MELDVKKTDGKAAGKVTLSDAVFGIEPNQQAVYEDVRLYLANQRQGTHKIKGRSEVAGSTRKLYRQKGTGNARVGDAKSGTRRHGGTMHGPQPRDYGFKINKKQRRLARRSALSIKAGENAITVIEGLNFDTPKTQAFVEILNNLELSAEKVLVLTNTGNQNAYRSGRNLPLVEVMEARAAHTYAIMNADRLLCEPGAIEHFNTSLADA